MEIFVKKKQSKREEIVKLFNVEIGKSASRIQKKEFDRKTENILMTPWGLQATRQGQRPSIEKNDGVYAHH